MYLSSPKKRKSAGTGPTTSADESNDHLVLETPKKSKYSSESKAFVMGDESGTSSRKKSNGAGLEALLAQNSPSKKKHTSQLIDETVEDEEDGESTSGEKLSIKYDELKSYVKSMEKFLEEHGEYGDKTLTTALNAWQAKSHFSVSPDVIKEVRKIYTIASRKPTFSFCLSILHQFFESPSALHLYDDFPSRPAASAFIFWLRSHREEAGLSGLSLTEYHKKKTEARAGFDSDKKRVKRYTKKLAAEYQNYLAAVDDFRANHLAVLSKVQIRYLNTTKMSAQKKLCELDPSEKERFEAEQSEKKLSKAEAKKKKKTGVGKLKANTGFELFVLNEEKQGNLDPSLSAEDREHHYSAAYRALPQSSRDIYESLARAS